MTYKDLDKQVAQVRPKPPHERRAEFERWEAERERLEVERERADAAMVAREKRLNAAIYQCEAMAGLGDEFPILILNVELSKDDIEPFGRTSDSGARDIDMLLMRMDGQTYKQIAARCRMSHTLARLRIFTMLKRAFGAKVKTLKRAARE